MSQKLLRRLINLFLTLAITLAGTSWVSAAAGALDPTFGTGGLVITDFGNSNDDYGYDVTLQPDGKIVVAGSSFNGTNSDFALARYNSDGSPDTTFDDDGLVTTDFNNNDDVGGTIAPQPDGKIVLAGISYNGNNYDLALVRYNSDGSLDLTFDTDGKVTTVFDNRVEFVGGVALLPDGKIVVAGSSGNSSNYDFALVRYNSDGSLDATFDTDGLVTTDFGSGNDFGSAAALQSDAKIMVAGQSYNGSNYDFALARYNSDGSLDATFDTDGKLTTDFGNVDDYSSDLALQSDGKVVVAGITYNDIYADFALARYNSDGSLDATFDLDGKVTTDFSGSFEYLAAVALQPDGKIIVAGESVRDFALARYNSDGSLDNTFGTHGKVTTDFGGNDISEAVALQPDGKIIVAGAGGSNSDFALARYDVAPSTNEVTIDIKPGRPQNRIELEKNVCKHDDNLYVAILTTPDFDAQLVDTTSLKLGDPLLQGTISPQRIRIRDVDFDGDNDLAVAFSLCKLVNKRALNTSTTELVLTGMTLDGNSFLGRGSVKVVRDK